MFDWHVEDGNLLKDTSYKINKVFACESKTPREDKIAFLDSRHDGQISLILKLAEKLEKDKETMPKDSWGDVKTVSLNAWIKRNCSEPHLIDTEYHYGTIHIQGLSVSMGERKIQNINAKGAYDEHVDFVDEMFRRELLNCKAEEKEYFRTHDEYTIYMDKIVKELQHGNFYTFGSSLSYGSSGLNLCAKEGEFEPNRKLTLEEMKLLNDLNERVAEFVEDLKAENDIEFDNPKGKMPDKKKLDYLER